MNALLDTPLVIKVSNMASLLKNVTLDARPRSLLRIDEEVPQVLATPYDPGVFDRAAEAIVLLASLPFRCVFP